MKNADINSALRMGFGIFFMIWGVERLMRTDQWASANMLGNFYGHGGTVYGLVLTVAIVQLLIALAFFTNFQTKTASVVALVMISSSIVVTIVPMVTYLIQGGTPIPNVLFADHYPLLAGVVAMYATSE